MLTTLAFAIALVVFLVLLIVGLFLYDNLKQRGYSPYTPAGTIDNPLPAKIIYDSLVCRLLYRVFYVWSFTLGTTIYVRGDWLAPSALRHELQHVRQWDLLGARTFIYYFIAGIVKHGFHDSPLEVEARRAATGITQLV